MPSLSTQIRAGRTFALDFFMRADFERRVFEMTDDEFERLVTETRKLVSSSLAEHNRQLRYLPDADADRLKAEGRWSEMVDITTAMRYVSEVEADLRKLRKRMRRT